jgi:CDP-6-deoxy-D-xylo-4-hexulose-3-dehydrase
VTLGEKVFEFEDIFAVQNRVGNAVMSNSGSSANLLGVSSLMSPHYERRLRAGDEVIVPALSWSTTVWPLIQVGLVPVVVDIDPLTLNIDPRAVERAIGPKTKAVLCVHVYGNPCDMTQLTDICAKHELLLLEDCCEALGARYLDKSVGTFGTWGTFSFYYSHHITTLEGGITVTDDSELAEIMRIQRAHGWLRELKKPEIFQKRYPDIDERFLFVDVGYNVRPTEVQAAFGLVQLPKLDAFVKRRRQNTTLIREMLRPASGCISMQEETKGGYSSCFGLPLVLGEQAIVEISALRSHLFESGIETRPIICGNIARQPAMSYYEHRVVGDLVNANKVMLRGFTFGNHQDLTRDDLTYACECLLRAIKIAG